MRAAILSAGLLLVAACASTPPGAPLPPLPPVPSAASGVANNSPSPGRNAPSRSASDQCGAGDLQYLVGRPKTEIPIPVAPGDRRVLCTICPMTRDYRIDRQTILFDANSGLVTSVACN